ncbi:hypothetical protein LINGRAPRIM_LOCUS147 [Linum grandiflorum]
MATSAIHEEVDVDKPVPGRFPVLIQEQAVLRVHFFVWRIKKWRKLKPQRIGRRKMIDFWFRKKRIVLISLP